MVESHLKYRATSYINQPITPIDHYQPLSISIDTKGVQSETEYLSWKEDSDAHLKGYNGLLEFEHAAADSARVFNEEAFALVATILIEVERAGALPTVWRWTGTGSPRPENYTFEPFSKMEYALNTMLQSGHIPEIVRDTANQADGNINLLLNGLFIVCKTNDAESIISTINNALNQTEIWDRLKLLQRHHHDAEEAIQKFDERLSQLIRHVNSGVPLKGECEVYKTIADTYYSALEVVGGHRNLDDITK